MNEKNSEKPTVVYNPQMADQLLRLGYTILRIKPHNRFPKSSVFYFKTEDGLEEVLAGLSKKYESTKKKADDQTETTSDNTKKEEATNV